MQPGRRRGRPGEYRSAARADCLDYCKLPRGRAPAGCRDAGTAARRVTRMTRVGDPDVNSVGWDILLVLAVILIGGFFAAAEMALVSLREGQVRAIGKRGKRGQRTARLAQDPNRFLSSVQIGVTLATLMSGAFGAALLSDKLAGALNQSPGCRDGVATLLALIVVTLAISFFTLVFGELAPKRLALQRAERVALFGRPGRGPAGHAGPAAGLAAVEVYEPGGAAAWRRSGGWPRGDDR